MQKKELYEKAILEIGDRNKDLTDKDLVSKMATVAAVLKDNMDHYLWCGFYFAEEGEMMAGPYQGPSACPNISYDGVCGESAKKKDSVVVPNVHDFPGHIVCDERSMSEIVVPIKDERGEVVAVFDVDCEQENGFDDVDKEYLNKIMSNLL
tara:strand:+ start:206 stop:658 length:453 start_codon:yes stop_codon:yes gene_type:complete